MVDLEAIINQKNAADAKWKADRQAQRKEITDAQDEGITQITTDPDTYARYLTMQGDNFTYSPGNIALVMQGMPTATVFGTVDRWRNLGRSVDSMELNRGVKIFARSANRKGYDLTSAYDISQTAGRDLRTIQIKDDSPEMAVAMQTLLNYSPVPVVADLEMETPAFYDAQSLELAIRSGYPDHEAFAAIAAEVAHARFHNRGRNGDYHRPESELDAQSISYILCRHLGISRDLPDLSRLPDLYQDGPTESRKSILDGIQDMSKMIGTSIEREITPQQRTIQVNRRPPARQGPR